MSSFRRERERKCVNDGGNDSFIVAGFGFFFFFVFFPES